jgi:hypothetical protein
MTTLQSEAIGSAFESEAQATLSDFDLPALRFLVSLIALSLPPLVFLITLRITSSISASYYTNARDPFVGLLFVIGALFWAYDGHPEPKVLEKEESAIEKAANQIGGLPRIVVSAIANGIYKIEQVLSKIPENLVSKIGGTAAIVAAICPTACDSCQTDPRSIVHYVAATILFSAIVYFCLIAFPYQTKVKIREEEIKKVELMKEQGKAASAEIHTLEEMQTKQKRRARFYLGCSLVIAVIMLALAAAQFTVPAETMVTLHLTYWAEFVALWLFGFAWLIATRTLPVFAHERERYHPFQKKVQMEK